jgi:uncharacterized membrane protein YozB (DUF420 family)
MPRQGFLGTGAPISADITLTIEIAMGVTLVLGMLLARRQSYRAHAWCQSVVVVLNLIVIAQVMVPAFRSQVAPKIPARLARPYYAVATGHATMGCIAELLGVYIILAAGAKVLPKSLRFVRYKLWMRIALAIWWLALLLGLTTYARWYVVPQHFSSTGSKAPARTIGSATNPTASATPVTLAVLFFEPDMIRAGGGPDNTEGLFSRFPSNRSTSTDILRSLLIRMMRRLPCWHRNE